MSGLLDMMRQHTPMLASGLGIPQPPPLQAVPKQQQPNPFQQALQNTWGRYMQRPPTQGVSPPGQPPNPQPGNPHMMYDPKVGWVDDLVFRPSYDLRNDPAALARVQQFYQRMLGKGAPQQQPPAHAMHPSSIRVDFHPPNEPEQPLQ